MRFSNLSRQYTAVWRQTNAIYDAWAKRHGLTYPELLAVLSLSAPGPAPRPEQIAETWLLSRQSVRTILQGFAKRGWLTLGEKRTESLIKTTALYNELFEEAAGR